MELEPESMRLEFLPPGKVTELSWGRPFSRMHTHTFAHTSGHRKDVMHARQFKLSPLTAHNRSLAQGTMPGVRVFSMFPLWGVPN